MVAEQQINILVVDDSAVIRGLISRALRDQADFDVVCSAVNGKDAIAKLQEHPEVEVIVLDIEMPEMNGLEALPELQKIVPDVKVLMASTLTQRNANISMQALSLGAADYLPKPSMQERESLQSFYRELVEKVRALGKATKAQRLRHAQPAPVTQAAVAAVSAAPVTPAVHVPTPSHAIRYPTARVQAIAIASSTGGPQALSQLFQELNGAELGVPIFVTQHMPPTFTTLLAKNIGKSAGREVKEAEHEEEVHNGAVYIAPGDYHMCVEKRGVKHVVQLNQNPAVNFCRPAADPMIDSLSAVYGSGLLVVVLTGMGADGSAAAKRAYDLGATVVAQDEASSVVWGMPGATMHTGACAALLDIPKTAEYIKKAGGR